MESAQATQILKDILFTLDRIKELLEKQEERAKRHEQRTVTEKLWGK